MNLIEPVLYIDPQAARPALLCGFCGGECFFPNLTCLRCERRRK